MEVPSQQHHPAALVIMCLDCHVWERTNAGVRQGSSGTWDPICPARDRPGQARTARPQRAAHGNCGAHWPRGTLGRKPVLVSKRTWGMVALFLHGGGGGGLFNFLYFRTSDFVMSVAGTSGSRNRGTWTPNQPLMFGETGHPREPPTEPTEAGVSASPGRRLAAVPSVLVSAWGHPERMTTDRDTAWDPRRQNHARPALSPGRLPCPTMSRWEAVQCQSLTNPRV